MRSDWLAAYAQAWESGDLGVVDLFTPDATYRSHIFREPHSGRDGIRACWERATATQRDVRVLVGKPLVEGDRVVAEWWTTMTEEEGPVTLPGVLLLDFDGDECRALREYWAYESGRREPFPEWGRFAPGEGGRAHAERWVQRYA
ncbi:MAG: nuclear transport factor 2 family protein, partial [Actinomycetota bacterium]|nr:nuclear transport factor 2 family protein [Actinomycetota bacterium]